MKRKKATLIILLVCLCLFLSGCTFSIPSGSLMAPPMASGDEKAVQSALKDYISSKFGASQAAQYKLKCPTEGEFRTSFILQDIDMDGNNEAVAFYSLNDSLESIHVNYLRKIDDVWQSIADWNSEYSGIREVLFGEMDKDGRMEMVIGWNMSASHDSHVCIFKLTQLSLTEIGSYIYTDMILTSMSSHDSLDLFLIRIGGSENQCTARLISIIDNTAKELGNTNIDGYIQSIDTITSISLSESKRGIWFDGIKDDLDIVTEFVYWNGESLVDPFYDSYSNATYLTERSSGMRSRDVDADGIMEWPRCEVLCQDKESNVWLIEWCSWDYQTDSMQTKFYAVAVPAQKYMFRIEESWITSTNVSYSSDKKELEISSTKNDSIILKVSSENPESSDANSDFEMISIPSQTSPLCVFYKPNNSVLSLDENEILYRMIVID